ncbi:MAG: hypothetical protein AMXMBFR47_30290 [Planctomycetota bacterium]
MEEDIGRAVNEDFIRLAKRAADGTEVLRSESDRGCALVGASMLDGTIEYLLRCFFLDEKRAVDGLLARGRPLATFSARIDVCRAVGLVSQELYSDLTIVRKIRNAAAHFEPESLTGHEFRFTEPAVADRCKCLASVPEQVRNQLPPRTTFELFTGLVSAIFAEYARNSRIVKDIGDYAHTSKGVKKEPFIEIRRRLLLELLPTVNFQEHFRKCFERSEPINEIGS